MAGNNLLIYVAIAIAVAVVIAYAIYSLAPPGSYSVNVSMRALNQGTVYPYNTSRFSIQVNNTGSAAVRNLTVGIYLNGVEIKYFTVTAPAHRGVDIPYNYTYTGSGAFGFQAVADPGRLLNIADRGGAQASVDVNVTPPEPPDVFTAVPNSNVTYAQNFTLTGTGLYSMSAVAQTYNIGVVNAAFSPTKSLMSALFGNIYGFVANGFGASLNYTDGTSAYVLWMQGTVSPALVNYVASTFRFPHRTANVSGGQAVLFETGNRTSMCTYYGGGWTKVLIYYNNSLNATCASVAGSTYAPTEANVLVDSLNASSILTKYQSRFFYTNSTVLGSSLLRSGNGTGVVDFFLNSHGIFTSMIQKTGIPSGVAKPLPCQGLVNSVNGTHICSYIYPTSTGTLQTQFGMVDTTEVTRDYKVTIYSLVNATDLQNARYNAAALIGSLRLNESAAAWNSIFSSTCGFPATSPFSCRFVSFDYFNNTANVSVTDMLGSQVRINSVNCSVAGLSMPYNSAATISSGASATLTFPCRYYSLPGPILTKSYGLALNYTYNNSTGLATGSLNVTTAGFG